MLQTGGSIVFITPLLVKEVRAMWRDRRAMRRQLWKRQHLAAVMFSTLYQWVQCRAAQKTAPFLGEVELFVTATMVKVMWSTPTVTSVCLSALLWAEKENTEVLSTHLKHKMCEWFKGLSWSAWMGEKEKKERKAFKGTWLSGTTSLWIHHRMYTNKYYVNILGFKLIFKMYMLQSIWMAFLNQGFIV